MAQGTGRRRYLTASASMWIRLDFLKDEVEGRISSRTLLERQDSTACRCLLPQQLLSSFGFQEIHAHNGPTPFCRCSI